MGLREFEQRLERVVEGTFARAFHSEVRPVEIGRRMIREIDDHRSVDVRGRTVVPNHFVVMLTTNDHAILSGISSTLCAELIAAAKDHAVSEGYIFVGPPVVELAARATLKPGAFSVSAVMKEVDKEAVRAASDHFVVLPSGERILLGSTPVVLGRHPACDITIDDINLSRRHAEIRPFEDGYALVDLGSTNASRINGLVTSNQQLRHGDEILIGATRIRFEVSAP